MTSADNDCGPNRGSRAEDEGYEAERDDGHPSINGTPSPPTKKPSVLSKLFTKLGLDVPTVLMMFK